MSDLTVGFARVDITPPPGTRMWLYPKERTAVGILDRLTASAVVFDNGEKRVVIISADLGGVSVSVMNEARRLISEAVATPTEAVLLHCTHTHTGPVAERTGEQANPEYVDWLLQKMRDAAVLAVQDLAPAKLSCARGTAKGIAFVRRYRMKDGTCKTNPAHNLLDDIVGPVGKPDDTVQLLIIKRENAPEIGIVHFQVHPDVIGGAKISADFPHFVRETYEKLLDNARCVYINGAQGDTNSGSIFRPQEVTKEQRYAHTAYMGRTIAMAALSNYELAEPLRGDAIGFAQKSIFVKYNKGRPEQMEDALYTVNLIKEYEAQGMGSWQAMRAASPKNTGVKNIATYWDALRIVELMHMPDDAEICLSAIRVGDVVFAGFPGEHFTDTGRAVRENSEAALTMTACCTNGYLGYFPTADAYSQGGYERSTARFACGTAEQLTEASKELVNSLK